MRAGGIKYMCKECVGLRVASRRERYRYTTYVGIYDYDTFR